MPDSLVEKRLASLQTWIVAGLAFMFVSACSFLIIAVLIVVTVGSRVQEAKRKSDQALACYVQPQMERSRTTLPTIQYYRDHPDELEAALKSLEEQRQLALDAWGVCESSDS